jgi:hypothetical protein
MKCDEYHTSAHPCRPWRLIGQPPEPICSELRESESPGLKRSENVKTAAGGGHPAVDVHQSIPAASMASPCRRISTKVLPAPCPARTVTAVEGARPVQMGVP